MIGSNMLKGIALASALALGSACAGVKKTTTDINPAMSRAPTCANAIAVFNSRAEVPYDYYELVQTVPADKAFRPLNEGGCPLVR